MHDALAPGVDHRTVGIEFDHRGRRLGVFLFVSGQIISIQDKYVVLRVYARAPNFSQNPQIFQRFGPCRIGLEFGHLLAGRGSGLDLSSEQTVGFKQRADRCYRCDDKNTFRIFRKPSSRFD